MTLTVPGSLLCQSLTIKMATDTTGSVQTGDSTSLHVGERRCVGPTQPTHCAVGGRPPEMGPHPAVLDPLMGDKAPSGVPRRYPDWSPQALSGSDSNCYWKAIAPSSKCRFTPKTYQRTGRYGHPLIERDGHCAGSSIGHNPLSPTGSQEGQRLPIVSRRTKMESRVSLLECAGIGARTCGP